MSESINETITLQDFTKVCGRSYDHLRGICKEYNISHVGKIKNRRLYDLEELEQLIKLRGKKPTKKKNLTRTKIFIIECFLNDKDNTAPRIANKLNLNISFVNSTIDEYLKNDNSIFVESKINKT